MRITALLVASLIVHVGVASPCDDTTPIIRVDDEQLHMIGRAGPLENRFRFRVFSQIEIADVQVRIVSPYKEPDIVAAAHPIDKSGLYESNFAIPSIGRPSTMTVVITATDADGRVATYSKETMVGDLFGAPDLPEPPKKTDDP